MTGLMWPSLHDVHVHPEHTEGTSAYYTWLPGGLDVDFA